MAFRYMFALMAVICLIAVSVTARPGHQVPEYRLNQITTFASYKESYRTAPVVNVIKQDNGLCIIELSRPYQMNTFTVEQSIHSALALDEIDEDDACSVALFTGTGPIFTAGVDLAEFVAIYEAQHPFESPKAEIEFWKFQMENSVSATFRAFINFKKVLIYAAQGPAMGMGATMSQLADFTFIADNGYFAAPFMALGLAPEACSTHTFPKTLGQQLANAVLLNDRTLTPSEAKTRGFVYDTFPAATFKTKVLEFANTYATKWNVNSTKLAKSLLRTEEERRYMLSLTRIEADHLSKNMVTERTKAAVYVWAALQTPIPQPATTVVEETVEA